MPAASELDVWLETLDTPSEPVNDNGLDDWLAGLDAPKKPGALDTPYTLSPQTTDTEQGFSVAPRGRADKPYSPEEVKALTHASATRNLSPAERERYLASQEQMDQVSIGDRAVELVGGGVRGLLTIPKNLARAEALVEDAITRVVSKPHPTYGYSQSAGHDVARAIDEVSQSFMADPRQQGAFTTTLAETAGQMVPMIATGGVASLLGRYGPHVVTALLGAGLEAAEIYEDATKNGVKEGDALRLSAWGIPVGAVEFIGLNRILKSFKGTDGIGKAIKQALAAGAENTGQEMVQTVGENLVAKGYSDRDIWEGVGQAGSAAGIVSSILSLGAASLGARIRRTSSPPEAAPGPTAASPPQRFARETLLTPGGAAAFARAMPEAAASIAAKTQPTRTDMKGVRVEGQKLDETDRARLSQLLREQAQPEQRQPSALQPSPQQEIANEVPETQEGQKGQAQALLDPRSPMVTSDAQPGPVQSEQAPASFRERAEQAMREAEEVIRGKGATVRAGFDPELFAAYVKYGANWAKVAAADFAQFTTHMVQKFGDTVKPHLDRMWQSVQEYRDDGTQFARPDLANPATEPQARNTVDIADQVRNQQGRPEVRKDSVVQQEAANILADYEKARDRLVSIGTSGGQLGDSETVAAKAIVAREGMKAVRSGNADEILKFVAIADAYRETGKTQAQAFRQRRDPIETPAERNARLINEELLRPPEAIQQKIDRAKKKGTPEQVAAAQKEWAQEVPKITEQLALIGVTPEALEQAAADPVAAARAMGTIQAAKASNWDKAYEYWRNAILSAPTTGVTNTVSNVAHAGWHYTAERAAEAMVNAIGGQKDAAQLGEFKYLLRGILPGLSRAAQNFVKSWAAEVPSFEQTVTGGEGATRIEDANVAIKGKLGRAVRVPQRLLLASDEAMKSLLWTMEVGARAYRMAKAEGLTGDAMVSRIHELTTTPGSDAQTQALEDVKEILFQAEPGKVGRNLLLARKDIPGLRYLLPFVTTPVNIFKTGIRKSPAGAVNLAYRIAQAAKTGDWSKVPRAAAEQLLAWTVVLALLGNDEDEPWITGAESQVEREKLGLARRTHPPQSIRIGDKWIDYSRIEPSATVLAVAVDGVNAFKSGSTKRVVNLPFDNIVGQMKNKTFLNGIGDLLVALEGDNANDKLARWASSFATSWVPNIARAAGRSADDEFSERGVWGQDADYAKRLGRRTLQKTELGLIEDVPAYDIWGRPNRKGSLGGPRTDWLYRMLVPAYVNDPEVFIGDRLLLNWNNAHPDDPKLPQAPAKRFKDATGTERYMTDQEYSQYVRLSGEIARELVSLEVLDADNPTETDIEILTDAIASARRTAKSALAAQWAGGPEASLDTKEIAAELHDKKLSSLASTLARPIPLNPQKRAAYLADRDAALDTLRELGADPADVRRAYVVNRVRKMKSTSGRSANLTRLAGNLRRLTSSPASESPRPTP